MKINKNLLVGLGIGLLAYYLYTRNKKKVQQPAVEQSKVGGLVPPASTPNNNKPNSLSELAAKAPTNLPNNIFSPPKIRQTQEEKECYFQYISMPKPKVIMRPEYWKSHQENFIKECIERKNRVR
jgi:hypothetical protein